MEIDFDRIRSLLKESDFKRLFVEELGWDRHKATLEVTVDEKMFALQSVAQKRGMVAFVLTADGEQLLDYPTRRKVERKVAKSFHEHLIIYTDAERTTHIWQWVKREIGKPAACRWSRDVARWFRLAYLLADSFDCRCLNSLTMLRFHIPLFKPDVRFSRIRLSDKDSRFRPRQALRKQRQFH